jgi:phosphoribulokinase
MLNPSQFDDPKLDEHTQNQLLKKFVRGEIQKLSDDFAEMNYFVKAHDDYLALIQDALNKIRIDIKRLDLVATSNHKTTLWSRLFKN